MGWALNYIKKLEAGETIEFRPRGNSMQPRICSGDLVRVEPVKLEDIEKGNIVLCHVAGNDYLHLVTSIASCGGSRSFQISNAKGRVNGYTRAIYGKVVDVRK